MYTIYIFPVGRNIESGRYVSNFVNYMEKAINKNYSINDVFFIEAVNPVTALIAEEASYRWKKPSISGIFLTNSFGTNMYGAQEWSDLLINLIYRNAIYSMNQDCVISHQDIYQQMDFSNVPIFPLPVSSAEYKYICFRILI